MLSTIVAMFVASCSRDNVTTVVEDDQVQVSFVVPLPDGAISTRAVGDGTQAKKLYWAVYDENDALLADISSNKTAAFAQTTTDGKPYDTVNIRLVKGQTYSVVFWAQNSDTDVYTIEGDNDLTNISVDYVGLANDETRDAFFGKQWIEKVTTDESYTVELKRPFAQVNVGVSNDEWQAATKAGVTIAKSSISFTDIANNFNALNGEAAGAVDVDYALNAILPATEVLNVDTDGDGEDEKFKYLTMAYILAGEISDTTDAVLGFEGAEGEAISLNVTGMAYQRNYRTNIIGHVLTSSNDFTVIIDSKFKDSIIVDVDEVETFKQLTDAVDALTGSANGFYNLADELEGDNVITLPAALTDGQLNFNFDDIAAGAKLTITDANDQYTGEVIISAPKDVLASLIIDLPNATVTVVGNYGSITSTTADNTLVVDASATIEQLTVNQGNVVINGTVKALTRADGYTGTITLNTASYDAYEAIKAGVDNLNLTLASGEYKKVFDVTGGKTININAAEGADVKVAAIGHESNGTPSTVTVKGITLDNSLTPAGWYTGTAPNIAPCVGAWGGNFTFEDCKFVVAGTSGKETGVMTWWVASLTTFKFDNCTFEGLDNHESARAMQIYGEVDMEVNNCTFTTKKDYSLKYVGKEGNVATFNNNVVSNTENFIELGSAPYAGKNYTAVINNTTLGEGINPFIVANNEGQTVIVDGAYCVSNAATLSAALAAGVKDVTMLPNDYNATEIKNASFKTLTLRAFSDGVNININQNNAVALGTFDGSNMTFEGINFVAPGGIYKGFARMQATYNQCNFTKLYFTFQGTHTFNGCKFDAAGDEHCVWTYGADNVIFEECDFNYADRCINVYTEMGVKEGKLTCDGCKFTTENESSKGAVEINSSSFATSVTVNLNACVEPAYGEMVFISGWDTANGAKAVVNIDGVKAEVPQLEK